MSLSKKQEEIVKTEHNKVVVMCAAAAGKTRILTERVRFLLNNNVEPSEICVITFTNLACQELKERLGEDYRDGLVISTIHGLANRFLLRNGYNTSKLIQEADFDKFFPILKQNPQYIEHFQYVLLDEAQDTSKDQFEFIFDMIKPEHFFVAGDYRQCIYSWRNASPECLIQLSQKDDVVTYELTENYRNGMNILQYAKILLRGSSLSDNSVPIRHGGIVYERIYDLDFLANTIDSIDTYADWAILCRTNDEIDFIVKDLKKCDIPCVTFKQGELNKAQLEKFMRDNVVKVLTVWGAKGLEFNNVAVYGLYNSRQEENYRLQYVAATRARNNLIWFRKPKKNKKTKMFGE